MFAEAISTITCSPLLIGQPLSSVSCAATRATAITGVSQRSSSSTARGTHGGVSDELPALLRLLGEVTEEAVERRRDGVEAGDQEQEADVEDVLAAQPVAVDLGVEELAQQIVLACPPRSSSTSSKYS